ncbi:MAG: D-Ala-D-Ala carboxypeptidase family metallohydrolase [Candidatus Cloacimonetes bacterium]|nr:D-Ala-D-Ala carboxypeptidase family metallohydrolase [Candidatus Cloacimonadota bacterium]
MNQATDLEIISRYRRVKGSGLFHLDEFSAVTGFPITRVIDIMNKLESSGEVVRFGHGVYLLKPVIQAKAVFQYDWQPDIQKLALLLNLITTSIWRQRMSIRNDWIYSDTSLSRYLRILTLTGHISAKRDGKKSLYRRVKKELTLSNSWQDLTRGSLSITGMPASPGMPASSLARSADVPIGSHPPKQGEIMPNLSKNLTLAEITCKCGCGLSKLHPKTISVFQSTRDYCGFALFITSGCRCPKHNKAVGGVADSAHTPNPEGFCQALDIRFASSAQLFKIMCGLIKAGCKRIGINFAKSFVHFDTDPTKPQNVIFKY